MLMESILLVDDEKVLRFTFREFLEAGGYEVTTAADYDEAFKALTEKDFDLIVTDIILGGKTGIDLLKKVKEMEITCPVIVLTGYPDVETAAEAVRLGAFNYLSKPVDHETLLNAARIALKYKKVLDKEERYKTNLDAIYKSVKEAIITVNDELKIIEVNEAAKICGLTRDDIGKEYDSLASVCSGNCTEALRKTIKTRKSVETERIECRVANRPAQLVSITTSPLINDAGHYSGAVMVIFDETRLAELERNLRERTRFRNIIGSSSRMQELYRMIENLSRVDSTVLITGESGTGKELVATALHYGSEKRGKAPFVAINCAAIPENLIESELFGHEKGAFTGAVAARQGKFELAGGGTLMLDEIGDMPFPLQAKLLRVLEESEIHRVGGERTIKIDTRVIASTNRDLKEKVKAGEFREDLYYRLKVVEIIVPPLRSRLADISSLTSHFIEQFNEKFDKKIKGISSDVERLFMNHPWPGNIRELRHIIEHAAILCDNHVITLKDLPADLRETSQGEEREQPDTDKSETGAILKVLEKARWNKTEAARLLGIDRTTLYRKMKKLGLA